MQKGKLKNKLTKVEKQAVIPFNQAAGALEQAAADFANALSEVKPDQYAEALRWTGTLSKLADTYDTSIKKKVADFVRENGETYTEAGSMRAACGGQILTIQPTRTGYDKKKVEALLRAKGQSPQMYMVQEITYSMGDDTIGKILGAQVATPDELNTCKYEVNYKVMQPKNAEEVQ